MPIIPRKLHTKYQYHLRQKCCKVDVPISTDVADQLCEIEIANFMSFYIFLVGQLTFSARTNPKSQAKSKSQVLHE